MKKVITLLLLSIAVVCTSPVFAKGFVKDPVKIEVVSKSATIEDALATARNVLLENKFISENGIQKNTFTATRTTNAKADYYVADVSAAKEGEQVKITITFVKVGTGLLNLKKVADKVKETLEGK